MTDSGSQEEPRSRRETILRALIREDHAFSDAVCDGCSIRADVAERAVAEWEQTPREPTAGEALAAAQAMHLRPPTENDVALARVALRAAFAVSTREPDDG